MITLLGCSMNILKPFSSPLSLSQAPSSTLLDVNPEDAGPTGQVTPYIAAL